MHELTRRGEDSYVQFLLEMHEHEIAGYDLQYNNRGRMKTSKVGTAATTTYVYNALGQRVKKSGGVSGTVLYMYDEAGHLLGEYSSTGALVQETVWFGEMK